MKHFNPILSCVFGPIFRFICYVTLILWFIRLGIIENKHPDLELTSNGSCGHSSISSRACQAEELVFNLHPPYFVGITAIIDYYKSVWFHVK